MMHRPRAIHAAALFCCAVALAGARCRSGPAPLAERIDRALEQAGRYMIAKQSPDGAWRSETYGALKLGPALTSYCMSSLFFIPQAEPEARAAYRKGADYLAGFIDAEGRFTVAPRELPYPVYTAASAARVIVLEERSPSNVRAQAAWLAYLRGRQLNESLGWSPADPEYGGWGFSLEPPRKPGPGEMRDRFVESNLSATVFGLAALRSAKVPLDDPSYRQVLTFAERCQNFPGDPARDHPAFDDGGFFFIPNDPGQNKAGVAGVDRFGRERYLSYGTMTADGLRILIRCGLPPDHPRVAAARRWLEWHFDAASNPGEFPADRAILQDATYYYWVWAAAHAFLALRTADIETRHGRANWAVEMADELIRRQREDGSWVNRYTDAKEDDPLVATPWAAAALAICRTFATGEFNTLGNPCGTMHPAGHKVHP